MIIFNLFHFFSLRYLFSSPLRSGLTILGVSLGISLFLSMVLIHDASLRGFEVVVGALSGKAHLSVTSDGMGFSEDVTSVIQGTPGVGLITPMTINHVLIKRLNEPGGTPMVFLGVDLLKDSAIRSYDGDQVIPDPLAFLNQADSIIVTEAWARTHGLGLEDQVELLTRGGAKRFTVRGMMHDPEAARAFDGNMAIMDIDGARYNFGREGKLDRLDLMVKDDASVEEVKREVRTRLGVRFKVEDKAEQTASLQQMIKSMQDLSSFMGILSFVVGFFIIANTVNVAVAQRRKDYGSLKVFGAQNLHLFLLTVFEFTLLGALSSLVGCLGGVFLAEVLVEKFSSGLSAQMMTNLPTMSIQFKASHLALALCLGTVSSVLALIYPMIKTFAVSPIEAIRPSIKEFRGGGTRTWVILGIAGLALFLASSALGILSESVPLLRSKPLQLVGLVGGLLGVSLLCPFLTLQLLSRFAKLPFPFTLRLPLSNLLNVPQRTASNSLHLTVAFILFVLVSAVTLSFKGTIINWARQITGMENVVNVTAWGNLAGLQVQPLHEDLAQELSKLEGIDRGVPVPVIGTRISHLLLDDKRVVIKAIDDPGKPELRRFYDPVVGDRYDMGESLFDLEKPAVLVSEPFISAFGKKPGDRLVLPTPQGSREFRVAGVVRDFASPAGVIYMDRRTYRRLWDDPLVSIFSVFHDSEEGSVEFLTRVTPLLEAQHLMVTLPSLIADNITKTVENNLAIASSAKWICLFVGMLGLLNAMVVAIIHRYREIGGLRSIGMTRLQLLGMVFLESSLLGIAGMISALLVGAPLAYVWVKWTLSVFLGWKVDFAFSGQDLLLVFLTGSLVSAFAGLLPAIRAARLSLKETLEYE